jgi:hypothetical protein
MWVALDCSHDVLEYSSEGSLASEPVEQGRRSCPCEVSQTARSSATFRDSRSRSGRKRGRAGTRSVDAPHSPSSEAELRLSAPALRPTGMKEGRMSTGSRQATSTRSCPATPTVGAGSTRAAPQSNANSDGSSTRCRYRPFASVALNGSGFRPTSPSSRGSPAPLQEREPCRSRRKPLLKRNTGPAGIPCASESVASARCRASAVFALWGPGLMAAGPVPPAYSSPGAKTKEFLHEEGPVV